MKCKFQIFIALIAIFVGTQSVSAQYNREYFFWVGRQQMMENEFTEAIRTLNVLLRFDDDAYEGYFLRGIAKYNLDDLIGAEADFSIAIEKNPVFTNAYTYRAITRSRLGNYDDALKDFQPHDDDPTHTPVLLDLKGKNHGEIAAVFQYNYPIFTDDFRLRMEPEKFEKLRGSYQYRRDIYYIE